MLQLRRRIHDRNQPDYIKRQKTLAQQEPSVHGLSVSANDE